MTRLRLGFYTENGLAGGNQVEERFSATCFGAALLSSAPGGEYAELLIQRAIIIALAASPILVNTGWTLRPVRQGNRQNATEPAAIIAAIQSGALDRYHRRRRVGAPDRWIQPGVCPRSVTVVLYNRAVEMYFPQATPGLNKDPE